MNKMMKTLIFSLLFLGIALPMMARTITASITRNPGDRFCVSFQQFQSRPNRQIVVYFQVSEGVAPQLIAKVNTDAYCIDLLSAENEGIYYFFDMLYWAGDNPNDYLGCIKVTLTIRDVNLKIYSSLCLASGEQPFEKSKVEEKIKIRDVIKPKLIWYI